ncbi:MAG: BadF/BadG/BcrA/BcrD ATPase family protein [bacterium]
MRNKLVKRGYIIGVDGGGTKTVAALADLDGRILATARSGSANPRNVGIEKTGLSVAEAIAGVLKKAGKEKVFSIWIGLPALAEEFKNKKEEIKKEILKKQKDKRISAAKIVIGDDQIIAFRAGSASSKDGVLVVAGTGTACRGWKKNKEAKTSGCGWLADEGSAVWVGHKVFQTILKDLDSRGPRTLMTKMILKELEAASTGEFLDKVYNKDNPATILPRFSFYCDQAAIKGDKKAKEIMIGAGKELALSAEAVIKKLNFTKEKFSLVLCGGMFKSKLLLAIVKKEIKKIAPHADFIVLADPVIGAVRLAKEAAGK